MNKIIETVALVETSEGDFNRKAQGLVASGYQPFGSISVSVAKADHSPAFLKIGQLFVKYEEQNQTQTYNPR